MRRWALLPAVLAVLASAGCLPEAKSRPGISAYNVDDTGLALNGYSPVSYLDEGRAEPGSRDHAVTWRGITYLLTSDEQRAAFLRDPDKYEPVCGGWCAYGMSLGIRWDPDPGNFEVIEGRLYLFSRGGDADARELWDREKDRAAMLDRVDHYWRSLSTD